VVEADVEARVREMWSRGDRDAAVTIVLRDYGPEILGLLVSMHKNHDEAAEAFSVFAERLWTTFDRFRFDCSVRTWAYVLARRAALDLLRSAKPRAQRNVALSQLPEVSALVAHVRTQTLSMYAEEKIAAFAALQQSLPEDDRTLLVLRVDRGLGWDEIARVFLDTDNPEPETLKREAARLRKRFQLVKERLRSLGEAQGLVRRREDRE
jgi:RNA polymerase sigma-70 factor, ECF subfamily